jgi:hypothetical protein
MVIRRTEADCALVALAMLLYKSYEDVIAITADPSAHKKGVYATQVQRIAESMGVTLRQKRKWDWETAEGIVFGDYITDKGKVERHAVLLKAGLIWDADFTVWEPEDYFIRFTPKLILVKDDENVR